MLSEQIVKRMRGFLALAHLKGETVNKARLAQEFTAKEINLAEAEGVIVLEGSSSDPIVRSTEIAPDLFQKAAAAASVPRAPPIQSADGNIWFWKVGEKVQPFAVLKTAKGYCLALTQGGRKPTVQSTNCWQFPVEYPTDALQHALVDGHDANLGYAEGLYQTEQPWRHPATDRPLSLRKP